MLVTNYFEFDQNINGMQSLRWANLNLHRHHNLELLRLDLNNGLVCSNQVHNQPLLSHMDIVVQLVKIGRMEMQMKLYTIKTL